MCYYNVVKSVSSFPPLTFFFFFFYQKAKSWLKKKRIKIHRALSCSNNHSVKPLPDFWLILFTQWVIGDKKLYPHLDEVCTKHNRRAFYLRATIKLARKAIGSVSKYISSSAALCRRWHTPHWVKSALMQTSALNLYSSRILSWRLQHLLIYSPIQVFFPGLTPPPFMPLACLG